MAKVKGERGLGDIYQLFFRLFNLYLGKDLLQGEKELSPLVFKGESRNIFLVKYTCFLLVFDGDVGIYVSMKYVSKKYLRFIGKRIRR